MVNDGTPEKTRSVFDRYRIVAPEDLRAAAATKSATLRAAGGKW